MKLETLAIHAGNQPDASSHAVIQPITLSSTFIRGEAGDYPGNHIYSRISNPNRASLENVLVKLEGGADACAFSSGNAAGAAIFQALEPGSHIVAPDDMYHGLRNLLNTVFKGILRISYVDQTDPEAVRMAITPDTRLLWMETPSNPLLKISDIAALAGIAANKGIATVCDSTFATPVFQNPILQGCDIVMHSLTKYLGGHSDVLGGALITKEKNELWEKVRNVQVLAGGVPAPFDCYLAVRGIKTLPCRMKAHAENAKILSEFLEKHPAVDRVFYPGLESHPQHETARRQMSGFGGMLSFLVKGGEVKSRQVVNSLKVFTQATSLGGVESLAEHRASVEGPDTKTPRNLLRVSVGLENAEDLLLDLENALKP